MPDFDEAQRASDRRMRLALLRAVDAAKVAGGMRGRMLADIFAYDPDAPDDDDSLVGLLRDLVNGGYLVETDLRRKKHDRITLDTRMYAITARGTALVNQAIPADPLIEDDRL